MDKITDVNDIDSMNRLLYQLPASGARISIVGADGQLNVISLSRQELTCAIMSLRRRILTSKSNAINAMCLNIINRIGESIS